ncbi:MAG: alpha/beta hydrolase-fold protein [Chloroflexi bacterium]|nr:alpha/beta hydrolase-fold protein [Chloroflexota bacterium]
MTYLRIILILSFALGLSACTSSSQPTPTPTTFPPTATTAPSATPTPIPTATPLTCLTQPGRVDSGELDSTKPPQLFMIYLPPCYDQNTSERYPVLYLLHGQTYNDNEWIRLGAPSAADKLIHSGKAPPFIIVFPDDRYWNLPPGTAFGERLINLIIPYVDQHYRTLADRDHRALGGLSRGGGWTIELGLQHYEMFGALGMHSPAIFVEDAPYIEDWIRAVPSNSWPRIWIDAGDQDKELGTIMQFESLLSYYQVPHEWHLYAGDHSENYWSAHVSEYLQWYAEGWVAESSTPQP